MGVMEGEGEERTSYVCRNGDYVEGMQTYDADETYAVDVSSYIQDFWI